MVLLVGGYKLTQAQALAWCHAHDIFPLEGNITALVNRWMRRQRLRIRLHACSYQKECIFLVLTDLRHDYSQGAFEPFEESEDAKRIKEQMGVGDVEFVTVADP
jgi:hypothetical protein